MTKAQLELDQDELEDVKADLIRSGADRLSRIQRQFNRHEATQKEYETNNPQTGAGNTNSNPQTGSSAAIVAVFRLEQLARQNDAIAAGIGRSQADRQYPQAKPRDAAVPGGDGSLQQGGDCAAGRRASSKLRRASGGSSASSTASAITSLHQISVDQKDLSDLDKRVQDQDDLATAYSSWIDVVKVRQRAVEHEMLQSAMLILLVVFGVYLANRLVDHFFVGLAVERTRLHTLRGVIRFAVQALGLALILFILFGLPNQMSTILGLAGAGLTVACKDFIMGFIGWFLLMGRNGLRVGDWVEIDGVVGEVVEIGLLRTVLLETGNWTDSGHPTGRKVAFVNSFAIEGHFFNFSTTGQWLWDEVEILVPASQNPYPIIDAIQKMVTEQTQANVARGRTGMAAFRQSLPGTAGFSGPGRQSASYQFRNRSARALHHAGGRAARDENPFVPGPGGVAARAAGRSGSGGQRKGCALETGLLRTTASFRYILQQTFFVAAGRCEPCRISRTSGRRQRSREFERPAQRRLFVAQQGNAYLPPRRPLGMMADRADECRRARRGASAP